MRLSAILTFALLISPATAADTIADQAQAAFGIFAKAKVVKTGRKVVLHGLKLIFRGLIVIAARCEIISFSGLFCEFGHASPV